MTFAWPRVEALSPSDSLPVTPPAPAEARRDRERWLARADVAPRDLYEQTRDTYLPHIRRVLRQRRVDLGGDVSVQFENRATAIYHLHEALRADGVWSARCVDEALDEHRRLIAEPDQVVATVMVHGGQRAGDLCGALAAARGGALRLRIGGRTVKARNLDDCDPRYPVQYVAFDLGADDWQSLGSERGPCTLVLFCGDSAPVAAPLSASVREALLADRFL